MNAPPERLFIDERVAGTMGRDGDPPPHSDSKFIEYIRLDVAQDVMQQAMGSTEFFIQVMPGPTERDIFGLTNYGRLFCKYYTDIEWVEWATPSLGPADGDDGAPR